MRRSQLAHLIRAACHATGEREVLVMGSQAALATWGEAAVPAQVTLSNEADIAFFHDPWELKADTVMGVLGQDSQFHQTYGVYADGIASDTALLPAGWVDRLVPFTSSGLSITLSSRRALDYRSGEHWEHRRRLAILAQHHASVMIVLRPQG